MATIPPPPVLAPLTLAPSNVAPVGQSRVQVWFWEILGGKWVFNEALASWDDYPAGYYATNWSDFDGVMVPNSWGEHTTVILVTSRTKPDGTAADYVLEQPPNAPPVPECPPGMLISFPPLYNVFGYHLPLCELTAGQSTTANCPPGTEWDPIAEICKAIVIPPIFVPPPPPGGPPPPTPPPPTPGQPDPYGDEITFDLCLQLRGYVDEIVYAINQLQIQQGQGPELDACCVAVTNAITGVTNTLGLIFNLLSKYTGAPPPQITFSPSITIDVPPQPPPTVTVNEAPFDQTNLDRIAKANETMAIQGDVPQAVLKQLFESGLLPKSLSNLLQGSPWSEVLASIEAWKDKVGHATWWQDISYGLRWLQALNGDPGTVYPTPSLDDPPLGGADASAAFANGTKAILQWGFDHFDEIASPFVKGILDAHAAEMRAMKDVKPGDELATATKLMTEASTFGVGAHFAAVLGEMVYPTKTLGFPQLAATLALFSGYDELIKGYLGSEVRAVITAPHTYATNARARPYLMNAAQAYGLSARRKLVDSDLAALLDFNGISPTYRAALDAGKYRPISPRQLATLIADQPLDTPKMRAILEDNSYSPDGVNFMLQFLEYNSTKTLRNSYISELVTAYKDGVVADDELTSTLQGIGWSTAAIALVKQKAALQRRVTLASAVEHQVVPLVANGNITADAGLQQLEAAGVQDWYAQLQITLATTKADIHALKIEEAAAARLELQRQRNLTKAAIAEYQRGVLDDAGLTAALTAIGLDPTLVVSVVAVQDATRTGRLRLTFGQLLLPQDAKILKDRVTAIEHQFKTELLSLDQARAQLQGLNIDTPETNAMLAAWAAELAAATKHGYLVNPLTGVKG